MREEIINRWTTPGQTDAQYPRLTLDPATYGLDNEWNYNSTLFLYDASLRTFEECKLRLQLQDHAREEVVHQ